jgi:GntR family transcriptional regulator/MocR family aminotransferase
MGWLVVPVELVGPLRFEKRLADRGTAPIDPRAFAEFLTRGELDRHLRNMRHVYRGRRNALVAALAEELPEAVVHGIAAGMHVVVELTPEDDQAAILEEARRRRIRFETLTDFGRPAGGPPVLMRGYGQIPEPANPDGNRELAEAVREARSRRA